MFAAGLVAVPTVVRCMEKPMQAGFVAGWPSAFGPPKPYPAFEAASRMAAVWQKLVAAADPYKKNEIK